jgi:hypothetical protein
VREKMDIDVKEIRKAGEEIREVSGKLIQLVETRMGDKSDIIQDLKKKYNIKDDYRAWLNRVESRTYHSPDSRDFIHTFGFMPTFHELCYIESDKKNWIWAGGAGLPEGKYDGIWCSMREEEHTTSHDWDFSRIDSNFVIMEKREYKDGMTGSLHFKIILIKRGGFIQAINLPMFERVDIKIDFYENLSKRIKYICSNLPEGPLSRDLVKGYNLVYDKEPLDIDLRDALKKEFGFDYELQHFAREKDRYFDKLWCIYRVWDLIPGFIDPERKFMCFCAEVWPDPTSFSHDWEFVEVNSKYVYLEKRDKGILFTLHLNFMDEQWLKEKILEDYQKAKIKEYLDSYSPATRFAFKQLGYPDFVIEDIDKIKEEVREFGIERVLKEYELIQAGLIYGLDKGRKEKD